MLISKIYTQLSAKMPLERDNLRKQYFQIKKCQTPKNISFLAITFFWCIFVLSYVYIFEIYIKLRIFCTKRPSQYCLIHFYKRDKNAKWLRGGPNQLMDESRRQRENGTRLKRTAKGRLSDEHQRSLVVNSNKSLVALSGFHCVTKQSASKIQGQAQIKQRRAEAITAARGTGQRVQKRRVTGYRSPVTGRVLVTCDPGTHAQPPAAEQVRSPATQTILISIYTSTTPVQNAGQPSTGHLRSGGCGSPATQGLVRSHLRQSRSGHLRPKTTTDILTMASDSESEMEEERSQQSEQQADQHGGSQQTDQQGASQLGAGETQKKKGRLPKDKQQKDPKDPCLCCGENCGRQQASVQCIICTTWAHKDCLKMTDAAFKTMNDQKKEFGKAFWTCRACLNFGQRISHHLQEIRMKSDENEKRIQGNEFRTERVERELEEMKREMKKMEERLEEKLAKQKQEKDDEICDEMHEREVRRMNLILHGVNEPPDTVRGSRERAEKDKEECEKIFRTMRARMKASDLCFCRRIGEKGNGPRPLVVGLENEEEKRHLLARARDLHGSQYNDVSVVPDLTRKQRNREARMKEEADQKNGQLSREDRERNMQWMVVGRRGEKRIIKTVQQDQQRPRIWSDRGEGRNIRGGHEREDERNRSNSDGGNAVRGNTGGAGNGDWSWTGARPRQGNYTQRETDRPENRQENRWSHNNRHGNKRMLEGRESEEEGQERRRQRYQTCYTQTFRAYIANLVNLRQ